MKRLLTLLFLSSLFFTLNAADSYTSTLSEFLEVSGVTATHKKLAGDLATKFGVSTTDSKYTKVLGEQIAKLNQDLTPIYKEYVTENDLKSMIKFFKSPVGKGFVESQPEILEKSVAVISDWKSGLKDTLMKSGSDALKKSLPGFSF